MSYWEECIREAFTENKIMATEEQIQSVVGWVEGAHENYGMAHGHDSIPNPLALENDRLQRELKKEQNKTVCKECNGKGLFRVDGPAHYSMHDCHKCHGTGWVA